MGGDCGGLLPQSPPVYTLHGWNVDVAGVVGLLRHMSSPPGTRWVPGVVGVRAAVAPRLRVKGSMCALHHTAKWRVPQRGRPIQAKLLLTAVFMYRVSGQICP